MTVCPSRQITNRWYEFFWKILALIIGRLLTYDHLGFIIIYH